MIEIKLIKNTLLFLSVLGIAQTGSSAVHRTYSANNTIINNSATSNYNSTRSITAASNSNYSSSQNIYSTNNAGGAYVSSNDELSQAISGLNARAQQKNYELATLTSRVYQNQTKSSDSLKERKKRKNTSIPKKPYAVAKNTNYEYFSIEEAKKKHSVDDKSKNADTYITIYKDEAGRVLLTNDNHSVNFEQFNKKVRTTYYKNASSNQETKK